METPTTGSEPDDEPLEAEEPDPTAGLAWQLGAGDVAAFKGLFDAHFDRLYRYVYRYLQSAEEAQDVVHDVFLRMWRQRRQIGIERDLRSYLYATARNHALDRLKRRRVERRWWEREAAALAAGEEHLAPDPDSELEARELAAAIQRAIDTLPRRQREVMQLRWQAQLSYEEIGRVLTISPKTVAIHLTRALQHLRDMLPGFLE